MKEGDFPLGTCVVKLKEEHEFRIADADGNVDINLTAA